MQEQNNDLSIDDKNFLDDLDKKEAKIIESHIIDGSRPTVITILCGYFFVSWLLSILRFVAILGYGQITSISFLGLSGLPGAVDIIVSFAIVISILGYWIMKKWAVYLYTFIILSVVLYVLLIRHQIFSFIHLPSLTLFAIVILVGFLNLKRMD